MTPKHHIGNRFRNPHQLHVSQSLLVGFKWWLTRDSQANVKKFRDQIPWKEIKPKSLRKKTSAPKITWLGHATVLLQHKGVNILFDPMFSHKCSSLPIFGPRRYTPVPIALKDLPKIDYVVISHNHLDHLDWRTVKRLKKSTMVAPLGVGKWFQKRGFKKVIELDWWEQRAEDDVTFTLTPTQHWSRRGPFDTNETLWGSWAVVFNDFKFWFAGDTGYNSHDFKEIGERFNGFDAAAIPIAAYAPRWFMKHTHVDPAQAVQIHKDIRSRWSFGIHWGTFVLSDEPIIEPPALVNMELKKRRIPLEEFQTIAIGESREIK